jgi:hypothetical protein
MILCRFSSLAALSCRHCGRGAVRLTLIALWLISLAPMPAAAAEVAFLVANKRSPDKSKPLRVIWNQIDASNARLKVPVPAEFQEGLQSVGIPSVVEYAATLQNRQYVIRNPEFALVVKYFATLLAKGMAALFGGEAKVGDVAVQEATILVMPGPWRLDAVVKTRASETVPGKPPQSILDGDFDVVGMIESLDPDALNRRVMAAYGQFIPDERKTGMVPRNQLLLVNDSEWGPAVKNARVERTRIAHLQGFTDFSAKPPMIYIRPGAPPTALVQEMTYLYSSPEVRAKLSYDLRDAVSGHLAKLAADAGGLGAQKLELSWADSPQAGIAKALVDGVGLETVARAYFGTGADLAALEAALDRKHNTSATLRKLQALMQQKKYADALRLITEN